MSIGGLISAVVGGVIGFVVGGPVGALYGISLGFALGMYVDPITPDMPSTGGPDQELLVMSGEVGTPIPDLAGTAKVTGHLLCYGGERADPVYTEVSGGKGGGGGSDPQVTGYKYYMSWAVGILAGEASTLYAVYKNDDVVWEGELDCPASGGEETITLDEMGSATFYFGTDDHALNTKVGALLDDSDLNVPYRNLCWCFFDDCFIGSYNRTPTMKFVLKKLPEYSFSDKHEIQIYDCNPAHIMWFILHDLMGLSESWLYSVDFATVALALWSEVRGLSVLFDRQQSALSYLESINAHVDNILRYGIDGKFHPKLIRDDYEVGNLPIIDEDVMLEEPTFNRKSWIDTLNEMKVQYSELVGAGEIPPEFGPIWGAGYNWYGNLSTGDTVSLHVFTELKITDYIKLCCGHENTVIISVDGSIWGTGWNDVGQLGLGDSANRYSFVQISAESWKKVDGGYQFNMFLKADNFLWGSGSNEHYGQLGLGDYVNRNVITQCLSAVQEIATGMYNTLAIKTDGTIWGTGRNDSGELGLNNLTNRNTFAQEAGGITTWQFITGGANHTMALRSDGSLWGTGSNYYGEMGLNDNSGRRVFTQEVGLSSWSKVSCKGSFTIAIKTDGTLWGTGKNDHHQLGLGDTTDRWVFTQIGSDSDWVDVSCGYGSTVVMKTDGALWGFGYNHNYALGLNHTNEVQVPTDLSIKAIQAACGASHTVIIKKA